MEFLFLQEEHQKWNYLKLYSFQFNNDLKKKKVEWERRSSFIENSEENENNKLG